MKCASSLEAVSHRSASAAEGVRVASLRVHGPALRSDACFLSTCVRLRLQLSSRDTRHHLFHPQNQNCRTFKQRSKAHTSRLRRGRCPLPTLKGTRCMSGSSRLRGQCVSQRFSPITGTSQRQSLRDKVCATTARHMITLRSRWRHDFMIMFLSLIVMLQYPSTRIPERGISRPT